MSAGGRVAWVAGWAVPAAWLARCAEEALPDWDHRVIPAGPGFLTEVRATETDGCAWIAGYSLGSLLLLDAQHSGWSPAGSVALIAPIWAFPADAGAGGRIPRGPLRALARRVGKAAPEAVADFYRFAGLTDIFDDPVGGERVEGELETRNRLAQPVSELLWGLAQLEGVTVPMELPEGWVAVCGDADPLVDAGIVKGRVPRVRVVGGAGHHPLPLMREFAQMIQEGA